MGKKKRSGRVTNSTRKREWVITLYGFDEETITMIKDLDNIRYGILGEEICPNTGRLHLQGYVALRNAMTMSGLKKAINRKTGLNAHIEPKKADDVRDAIGYCEKDGDFHEWGAKKGQGRRTDLEAISAISKKGGHGAMRQIRDEHYGSFVRYHSGIEKGLEIDRTRIEEEKEVIKYRGAELRNWQKQCIALLRNQDTRKILWVVDRVGKEGKTYLTGFIASRFEDVYETQSGKGADMAHGWDRQEYVIVDVPCSEESIFNYGSIEKLKNGRVWSGKYNSHIKIRSGGTKLVVFANKYPNRDRMMKDRFDIIDIQRMADGLDPLTQQEAREYGFIFVEKE